jgi:phosphohistidine phosphatase
LVRHARAEEAHPLGDDARGLTPEGRKRFAKQARRIARQIRLRGIATSPLVRAVQTAEILAEAAGVREIRIAGELTQGRGSAAKIVDLAATLGDRWALVGHNPSLAESIQLALELTEAPTLKKGAAVALRRKTKGWSLLWEI